MHCSEQIRGAGGDSWLCDGFRAAEQLRDEHPNHFEVLSTVPVYWRDVGGEPLTNEYSLESWHPTVGLVYQIARSFCR